MFNVNINICVPLGVGLYTHVNINICVPLGVGLYTLCFPTVHLPHTVTKGEKCFVASDIFVVVFGILSL